MPEGFDSCYGDVGGEEDRSVFDAADADADGDDGDADDARDAFVECYFAPMDDGHGYDPGVAAMDGDETTDAGDVEPDGSDAVDPDGGADLVDGEPLDGDPDGTGGDGSSGTPEGGDGPVILPAPLPPEERWARRTLLRGTAVAAVLADPATEPAVRSALVADLPTLRRRVARARRLRSRSRV